METKYLNIAGFVIRINFKLTEWEFALNKCKEGINEYYGGFMMKDKSKKIDYTINFVERKILEMTYRKKEKINLINFFEILNKDTIVTFYQISIFQFQIIIRTILQELLTSGKGFMLHSSSIEINNYAYIFTGKNGAGKSTAMKLLSGKYRALADDTVIVRKINRKYYMFQTPFIEKEAWVKKNSDQLPIAGFFFLEKAHYFKIETIKDKNYILNRLIKQFFTEQEYVKKQIKILMGFVNHFDHFNKLYFAKDAVKLGWELQNYQRFT